MPSFSISHTYNGNRKVYAVLFKGRPDEPESWKSIAVYSREEMDHFLGKGWQKDKYFMDRADRARRRDA